MMEEVEIETKIIQIPGTGGSRVILTAVIPSVINHIVFKELAYILAEKISSEVKVKLLEDNQGFERLIEEIRKSLAEKIFNPKEDKK